MKKRYLAMALAVSLMLAGCGEQETETSEGDMVAPTQQGEEAEESKADVNTKKQTAVTLDDELNILIGEYPLWEFGNHIVDEETVVWWENANLLDRGYLCEADEGMIYYNLPRDRGLYYGNADGTNRKFLLDREVSCLQMYEGQLYFLDEEEGRIYCYNPEEQREEKLTDERAASFMIRGEMLYYSALGGIYGVNLMTGAEDLLVATGKYSAVWMNGNEKMLVYVLADSAEPEVLKKGILFGYSFEEKEVGFIARGVSRPQVVGNKLYYEEITSRSLGGRNMTNGWYLAYDINSSQLSFRESNAFYVNYSIRVTENITDENSRTESPIMKRETVEQKFEYCYQTTDMLYIYTSEDKVCYYDKESGVMGVFE